MSKKEKKGDKLSKRLTKQLKKVIKLHGKELALGFVTGIVTKLVADKKGVTIKKGKKSEVPKDKVIATPVVKKRTNTQANKNKSANAPTSIPKTRVRKAVSKPAASQE